MQSMDPLIRMLELRLRRQREAVTLTESELSGARLVQGSVSNPAQTDVVVEAAKRPR